MDQPYDPMPSKLIEKRYRWAKQLATKGATKTKRDTGVRFMELIRDNAWWRGVANQLLDDLEAERVVIDELRLALANANEKEEVTT